MRRLLTATLFPLLAVATLAQTPLSNAPDTIHASARLVVVPTLVQSPAHDVIYSLTASDFLLTDKGAPQKIALDSNDQPLSLVVLMQTGSSAIQEFGKYKGLEAMLEEMLGKPPNQVSIVNFDSRPEAASPFTSDITQWTDAINQPEEGDTGAAILDGLKFAFQLLAQQPATHRRAILLISQPADSGSKTSAKEILRIAGETNTTIYALTFSPQLTMFKDSLKSKANFDLFLTLSSMRKNIASELALFSGGEAIEFHDQHQLDDGIGMLANHVRNRYMLTFNPTSHEPGLHPLLVRLPGHPDFIVSARSDYWLENSTQH